MKIVYFTHSLVSCWNHGNAHFLRGLLREFVARGHEVHSCEPAESWSRVNLETETASDSATQFGIRFPDLAHVVSQYGSVADITSAVQSAELVIVHEWTDPSIVGALGKMKVRGSASFTLLFHDTHHRAVSEPEAIGKLDLQGYDGVLAFGRSLADVYQRAGWGNRVFVFHEAADTRLFAPPSPEQERERSGAIWIGNWGDDERTEELIELLLRPAHDEEIALDIHGVRYPQQAIAALRTFGANYRGWLPNDKAADAFAQHLFTVHVPRRYYTNILPGIPTIRVFEALACGIPLISAPWNDSEHLFRPGQDFLVASTREMMASAMHALVHDDDLRRELSKNGLESIFRRHTCAHRVDELLAIVERLRPRYKGAA